MNFKASLLVVALAAIGSQVHAADWVAMMKFPAQITVTNMTPTMLEESTEKKEWAQVPTQLRINGASIYMPSGKTDGVADIKVLADGYLLLACNYDYQGNNGGKWDEEVWNEKKFKSKGWHLMSKNELGGVLVKGDKREQVVLSKQVHRGEVLRIRCNKYDPPYPIVLGAK